MSCEIIKDLLPLYHDEVCSAESVRLIEEHLEDCQACRMELDKFKATIPLPELEKINNRNEAAAMKRIVAVWRRSNVKWLTFGLLAATLLFGGYAGLSQWKIMKVSSNVIDVIEVNKLSDGRIAYHAKFTDGYDVNRIRYSMDGDGNFYLTPLRPVIKTKVLTERFSHLYDTLEHESYYYKEKYGQSAEITAIYFRTSGKDILIWKKGMELPAASPQFEAQFQPE
ncbi:hypothetical protein GOM71_08560 [Paenibacillus sp. NEAU-GSW1]|nr:hypothetical protein [Paenibacillus sp. NEAU-GSW1]